jgi:hypothetical protein
MDWKHITADQIIELAFKALVVVVVVTSLIGVAWDHIKDTFSSRR